MDILPTGQLIEVRLYKWPRRPISGTQAVLLGEDAYGRWIGVRQGAPWWSADGARRGVFAQTLVTLVPSGAFWTACFQPIEPVVDVDIALPVLWADGLLEQVDLELDVLRSAEGVVSVRDEDRFEQVRREHAMPDDIAAQAQAACSELAARLAAPDALFDAAGPAWLARFMVGEV